MSDIEISDSAESVANDKPMTRRGFLTAGAGVGLALAGGSLLAACAKSSPSSSTSTSKAISGKPITMRFGYTATQSNPVSLGYARFASLVEAQSKGTMKINMFCCGSLGNDIQLAQSAQSGALQIGDASANNLDPLTSVMEVLELPYLVTSPAAFRKFWQSPISDSVYTTFEKKLNLKLIMVMNAAGFRSIETTGAVVRVPSDLNGMKIRTASPIEVEVFKNWGADPVDLPYNQVVTALQQKTVDAEVLQPVWFYSDKHYEVAHYLCDIHYIMLAHLAFMNLDDYHALSSDQQAIIANASQNAENFEWNIAATLAAKADAALKAMPSFTWYTPTPTEIALWKSSSQPMWDKLASQVGGLARIRAVESL